VYILGINPGHDATCTLFKDGQVISAIAEERMSRIKYHFGFPYQSVAECLRLGKCKPSDIETVVFCFNSILKGKGNIGHIIMVNESGSIDPSNEFPIDFLWRLATNKICNKFTEGKPAQIYFHEALKKCGLTSKIVSYDHHLCHAASAYFDFGYDECLVVTADGAGDGLSASVSIGKSGRIERLHAVSDDNSLGRVYSAVTSLMGFKRNRHEGKITGLAAYGNPDQLVDKFYQAINLTADHSDIYSPIWKNTTRLKKKSMKLGAFLKGLYYHGAHPLLMDFLDKECAGYKRDDIAAAVQKISEDIMANYIRYYVKKTGMSKIALAGGIFANVRINQRILEIPEVDEIFVHPNMGDGGGATGAAYLYYNDELQKTNSYFSPRRIDNVFYGPSYSDNEIESQLKESGINYYCPEEFSKEVARLIANNKIVGHFNGKMEYGPRALGSRTIFANATDKTINDWLNKRLKRTEFMPFAPICLAEHADKVFDNFAASEYPANFMTIKGC